MSPLGQGILVVGAVLLAVAALGVLGLRDALSRQHAATKAGTLALTAICLGAMLVADDAGWTVRLAAILGFLTVTLPLASHLLARAALREGGTAERSQAQPAAGARDAAAAGPTAASGEGW